ncbi:DNA double-strand break repair nuclease NurA [Halostella pelagica]|uniref:DNA double-strand break repair nuclease NurA n=1 Tax=Halostella pelagica TaxID=2583824 RepID=UPI00108205AB|nr:DNA double-strand break repair nuclease NurA [Halostella pelagica]
MTLDPVHFEGIAKLARKISQDVDDGDHRELAERVWTDFLDPLVDDAGRRVVEPIGERRRRCIDVEAAALQDPPFPSTHGLDSGTINPTTFKNGLVLDVAQAAMSGCPSDLDLHRSRSLVATVHASDITVQLPENWVQYDDGYSRRRVLQAPRVSRFTEGVVHALALYLAESEHALEHADRVSDLLVLDGPLYPKELLNWQDRDAELRELAHDAKPNAIVENYVRLVERFVDENTPLVGFVKNPSAKLITRTVGEKGVAAPWVDDTAFFTRLLERRDEPGGTRDASNRESLDEAPGSNRRTDQLTFTNWFVSRGGSDRTLAADGDALGIERELDPEAYEVTFFVVYDPREDVLYKIEAPYEFTRDAETRGRLERQILAEVAAERGPPAAVHKADALARISREGKQSLRRAFERSLGSEELRRYDDLRWNEE